MQQGPSAARAIATGSLGGVVSYIWSHVILPWVIPLGAPMLTGYAGYAQGLPWMHILVGAGVMFAAVSTGLLRLDELLHRRRVKDKLQFVNVRRGVNINGRGFFLGVQLSNAALVPIEFELMEIRTRLGATIPTRTDFPQARIEIPAGGWGVFDDHVIDIDGPPSGTLEGLISAKFVYGKKGSRLGNTLDIKKRVILAFDAEGKLQSSSWNDAA